MNPIPEGVLRSVAEHCEQAYPEEGCGAISQIDGRWQTHAMSNTLAGSSGASTGYRLEPCELLDLLHSLDRRGGKLACLYHSHVDRDTCFSLEDRRHAQLDGEPLYPGVDYLVVGVRGGMVRDARLFTWQQTDWQDRQLIASLR
jgi:[CysO sulfur-carrier protein]-S-L-cysteine hydrolase